MEVLETETTINKQSTVNLLYVLKQATGHARLDSSATLTARIAAHSEHLHLLQLDVVVVVGTCIASECLVGECLAIAEARRLQPATTKW